jgi:hypothetical protein
MGIMQSDIDQARSVASEMWPDADMGSAGIVDISQMPADLEGHYSRGESGEEWILCEVVHYGRYRMFYDPGRNELNVSVHDG